MRKKKLYTRGDYYLAYDLRTDGSQRSKFIYIFWYDQSARRNRSRSTSTTDLEQAKEELDQLYDENVNKHKFCPTCGQAFSGESSPLLAVAINEYLRQSTYEAARHRLAHIINYLEANELEGARCDEIDENWVRRFRDWAAKVPIVSTKGNLRPRTPGTIEASVSQMRSAINHAFTSRKLAHRATFSVKAAEEVSKTPWFRCSEAQLSQMFEYALVLNPRDGATPKQIAKWKRERTALLQYLRLGVVTWARPDALMDFSTDPETQQWKPQVGYMDMNPAGRVQTKKYRPLVRAPRQMIPHLNANKGRFVAVTSVRTAFRQMVKTLEFPVGQSGQTGEKLVRRSVSHILRPMLEERKSWETQGRIMLGHVRPNESDKYATPYHLQYLADALEQIEGLIDRIEINAPGAFTRMKLE